jgi:hypothetical protein
MKRKSKGKLPREAVNFTRNLLDAGVPKSLLCNFGWDFEMPNAGGKVEHGLLIAMLYRIGYHSKSYAFNPVCINWILGRKDAKGLDVRINGAIKRGPGICRKLDQLQPELKGTNAAVFETQHLKSGLEILRSASGYLLPDCNPERFIMDKKMGFGIAHAHEIADSFSINPRTVINNITPITGPRSLCRSLFILLHFTHYTETDPSIPGIEKIAWWELRFMSSDMQSGKRVSSDLHIDLDILIPEGSLVAVANMDWFSGSGVRD